MATSDTGWPRAVPGVILISISLPSRLGEPCCAVESVRMRSVAGTPSILLSIVRNASIFCGLAAVPTSEGLNKRMRSTLPIRTPMAPFPLIVPRAIMPRTVSSSLDVASRSDWRLCARNWASCGFRHATSRSPGNSSMSGGRKLNAARLLMSSGLC